MRERSSSRKGTIFYRVGISAIIISLIIWIVPLVAPFLPLSVGLKASIISGTIVIAEILFWGGAIFAGKEVAMKIRSYFNPRNWRRKEVNHEENE